MVNFDDIDQWAPKLAAALRQHVPDTLGPKLAAMAPKYVEDARDLLFELTGRDAVIDGTLGWLRSTEIAAFHGTRLTDEEIASVKSCGLIPLRAEGRRARLVRALSRHPRWPDVRHRLDAVIEKHRPNREDQVHLTLSRAGLTERFNHYLTHGAEFDWHVADAILGPEGQNLLALDGESTVIEVAVPGNLALDAAHRFLTIDHVRARGDVPFLVNEFLQAWSYRLAHPGYQSRGLRADCGMMFPCTVPASWIRNVQVRVGVQPDR